MSQLMSAPAARPALDLFAPIARDLDEVERTLARNLDNPRPGVGGLIEARSNLQAARPRWPL